MEWKGRTTQAGQIVENRRGSTLLLAKQYRAASSCFTKSGKSRGHAAQKLGSLQAKKAKLQVHQRASKFREGNRKSAPPVLSEAFSQNQIE